MISQKKADALVVKLHDMAMSVYLNLPDKALSQFEDIALEARTNLHPPAPPATPQRRGLSQEEWIDFGDSHDRRTWDQGSIVSQVPLALTKAEREEEWEEEWDDVLEMIAQEADAAAQEIQNLIDDDEAYEEDDEASDEAVSTIEMGLGNVEEVIEVLAKTVEARP